MCKSGEMKHAIIATSTSCRSQPLCYFSPSEQRAHRVCRTGNWKHRTASVLFKCQPFTSAAVGTSSDQIPHIFRTSHLRRGKVSLAWYLECSPFHCERHARNLYKRRVGAVSQAMVQRSPLFRSAERLCHPAFPFNFIFCLSRYSD